LPAWEHKIASGRRTGGGIRPRSGRMANGGHHAPFATRHSPFAASSARPLSPPRSRDAYNARAACLRRDARIQHPVWQEAGAWKVGSRVGGTSSGRPGKPADGEAPAMAGNRRPPNGCMAGSNAPAMGRRGRPKSGPGQKSPHAGRRKATHGAGNRPLIGWCARHGAGCREAPFGRGGSRPMTWRWKSSAGPGCGNR
jgi:hypothetical protein